MQLEVIIWVGKIPGIFGISTRMNSTRLLKIFEIQCTLKMKPILPPYSEIFGMKLNFEVLRGQNRRREVTGSLGEVSQ